MRRIRKGNGMASCRRGAEKVFQVLLLLGRRKRMMRMRMLELLLLKMMLLQSQSCGCGIQMRGKTV